MGRFKQMISSLAPDTAIKAVSLAIFALLVWPIPSIVSFANPRDGVVFGRYTLVYFVLMVAYLAGTLVVGALAGLALLQLTPARLARLRHTAGSHAGLFMLVVGGVLVALAGIRAANLAGLISFPGSFVQPMTIIPGLLIASLVCLVILLVDGPMTQSMESRLARPLPRPSKTPLAGSTLSLIAALVLAALYILNLAGHGAFWNYPVSVDGSMQIYIGRTVLNGGVPYQAFVTLYGPIRLVFSIIWNLGADLFHIPVATFARAMNLLAGFGTLIGIYGLGKGLTGRSLGGLLSVIVLLGIEQIQDVLVIGPIFRPIEVLIMVTALWLAQHSRWFWAGIVAALATLMYAPIGLVALMLFVVALLQNEQPRGRAGIQVLLGGMLVAGLAVAVLALIGSLGAAYLEVVQPLFLFFAGAVSPHQGQAGSNFGNGLLAWVSRFPTIIGWQYSGDWELVALIGLGVVTTIVRRGKAAFLSPKVSAVLLTAVPLTLTILLDEGGSPDFYMRTAALSPFGAAALIDVLALLFSRSEAPLGVLWQTLGGAVCALLLLLGIADGFQHEQFLYSLVNIPMSKQQQMANELHAALRPDERVWCGMQMWYLAFTGDDNAIPIRRFGGKLDLDAATGWTPEHALGVVETNPPPVIMWLGSFPDPIGSWVSQNYVRAGKLDFDSQSFAQDIYVLKSRDDILHLVSGWPLQP